MFRPGALVQLPHASFFPGCQLIISNDDDEHVLLTYGVHFHILHESLWSKHDIRNLHTKQDHRLPFTKNIEKTKQTKETKDLSR